MLKPSQIRDMTVEEMEQRRHDIEEDLFNLKFRRSVQQIENPLKIRILRREIAKIKTILNENRPIAINHKAASAVSGDKAKQENS
ncbi:MAG: 50S ribosomal protein L29 [candidate division Zixibacteria bacterium CG_4_9_14_3_um_filter_46_8]|nr:MAG: 50S ribosomal protein L29 [candidate division Zixibacteria bacterium CG_4_9_14_3_um_filter_46_8]